MDPKTKKAGSDKRLEIARRMLKAGKTGPEIQTECIEATGRRMGFSTLSALRREMGLVKPYVRKAKRKGDRGRRKTAVKPAPVEIDTLLRLPASPAVLAALVSEAVPFAFDGQQVLMGRPA